MLFKKRRDQNLVDAVLENSKDKILRLIKKGADVNYRKNSDRDYTPLMFASDHEYFEIAKCLIDAGANVDAQADTSFDFASHKHLEIINGRGTTALMLSIIRGNIKILECLLENNANPNLQDHFGNTALINVAQINHRLDENSSSLLAKLLISNGAIIDLANDFNETALKRSAWTGWHQVTILLLESGANPNLADDKGNTALMGAVYKSDEYLVDLLFKYGADPFMKRMDGKTALTIAEEGNCKDISIKLRQIIYKNEDKKSEDGEIDRLIGLRDFDNLNKISIDLLPKMSEKLKKEDDPSNRKFIFEVLRKIDKNTYIEQCRKNSLIFDIVLKEGMYEPINIRVILVKNNEEIAGSLFANILTYTDYNLFTIDWSGYIFLENHEIQELIGAGNIYHWLGIEGKKMINKRLENIATDILNNQEDRYFLFGPRSSSIFNHINNENFRAAIYKVGLSNYFRQDMSELNNESKYCEKSEIISVIAANDRFINNDDQKILISCIQDQKMEKARSLLSIYFQSL